jgi:heme/copper-type cytochrome/quinol oxidase subunit 1
MSNGISAAHIPRDDRPGSDSWWRRYLVLVVGVVMVVAGGAVLLLAPTAVPVYGWTAYTPLSSGTDYSRTSYLTQQHLIGALVVVVGLIVVAAAIGFRLGARRRSW